MNGLRRVVYICIYIYIYIHTHNAISLTHKKNEIMPFAATWFVLETIKVNEVSGRQTSYGITYMGNLKNKWTQISLFTQEKQTHRI